MTRHQLDLHRGRFLPSGVGLFEPGAPDDTTDPLSFIMRVNRRVFLRAIRPAGRARLDLSTAISAKGKLGLHAELIVFGTWMVCNKMPGRKKRSGKAPDLRKMFKVTAVAFGALNAKPGSSRGKAAETGHIMSKDIVEFWKRCFDVATKTFDHSSSLRSLRLILPEYLAHLAAGHLEFNGLKVTASPQMSRLTKALKAPGSGSGARSPSGVPAPAASGGHSASPATSGASTSTPAATPTRFEIPLCYSSPEAETEYRNAGLSSPAISSLSYKILPVSATSAKHALRADRVGKLVLKPDYNIAGMVSVKALIDRIALVVSTRQLTSYQALQSAIAAGSGTTVYVADRKIKANKNDWQSQLPELDPSKLPGQHFAIMVQEPTPANLRSVLKTIEDSAGVEGEVRPFLLELALDFFPRNPADPAEALLSRERIVGLLQRHHWSAGLGFLAHEPDVPRQVDRRQVYQEEAQTKPMTRYLFSAAGDKTHSDIELHELTVRNRALNPKPGNDLYLNATVYQGALNAPRRINIQHKIADQRNSDKDTLVYLPDEVRRGRVELTLTSLETLEQVGLKTVEDLAQCRFRKISRNLLGFRLPTCMADADAIKEAIAQMKTRGVYGVELNQRATTQELRERIRPRPRQSDHDGMGLDDWPEMNALVGTALDGLRTKWQRF